MIIARHGVITSISRVDPDAVTHYNRVIADSGVANLDDVDFFYKGLKTIYGVNDITTVVKAAYDPKYLGYKLGAGSGVTLGQAVQKLYAPQSTADLTQTTAASQPLLLAHSGVNYWWNGGFSGNYVSTPDAAANQITGSLDIKVKVTFDSLAQTNVLAKWDGATKKQYTFGQNGSSKLTLGISTDGSTSINNSSTVNHPFIVGDTGWIRVTRNGSNGNITFYTSTDSTNNPSLVNWVQLGATVSATSSALFNASTIVEVGSIITGTGLPWSGKIYRATIANSIDGAAVVDFNPQSYNAATSQTNWTSATGEVWTTNNPNTTSNYKGTIVDRPMIQGDGTDDNLSNTILSISQPDTCYVVTRIFTGNPSAPYLFDGANTERQLIDYIATQYRMFAGGSVAAFGSFTNRNLITAIFNDAVQSNVRINNGSPLVTTGIGTQKLDGIRLMSRIGLDAGRFANINYNTLVFTNVADNSTRITAMYDLIRSLNNNAF